MWCLFLSFVMLSVKFARSVELNYDTLRITEESVSMKAKNNSNCRRIRAEVFASDCVLNLMENPCNASFSKNSTENETIVIPKDELPNGKLLRLSCLDTSTLSSYYRFDSGIKLMSSAC